MINGADLLSLLCLIIWLIYKVSWRRLKKSSHICLIEISQRLIRVHLSGESWEFGQGICWLTWDFVCQRKRLLEVASAGIVPGLGAPSSVWEESLRGWGWTPGHKCSGGHQRRLAPLERRESFCDISVVSGLRLWHTPTYSRMERAF